MTPTPPKPRRDGSQTGAIPRIDVEPEIQHEPPPPPTLPEFDEDGTSITGLIPRPEWAEEGDDDAKEEDDSPSATTAQG
jgi:hypothetical protein